MILEVALLHALAIPSPIDLKCRDTVPFPGGAYKAPVVVVDGHVFLSETEYQAAPIGPLERDDIYKIHLTCWDPSTEEIHSRSGVSVIAITTAEAMARTRADLELLISSVRDFEVAEARLPESLEELGIPASAIEGLSLESYDTGVRLSTSGLRDYHCFVTGDVTNDVEMQCEASLALAKAGLREAYARGLGFSN